VKRSWKMRKSTNLVLAGAAIALATAACADGTRDGDGPDETMERTPVATGETGEDPILRPWQLQSFGPAADLGDEATAALIVEALDSLPADNPVTLGLREEGRVGGFNGCNRYFGDFRVENGHQIVQGPKGATRMACPDGRMDLEQAFLRNLDTSTRLFLRGEMLELENDAGVVLVFTPREFEE
jgi:heat shock protein HslJ